MTLLFEPMTPLFGLSRELDRLLAPSGTAQLSFVPAADMVVTDDAVTVTIDLPGVTADQVSVELDGETLSVRGERPFPYETVGGDGRRVWQRLERGFGKFERVLRVPQGLDPETISATMADGVLSIRIPMPEARKPKRIEIVTGGAQPVLEQSQSETAEPRREPVGTAA
jgi:HSP20 family protein